MGSTTPHPKFPPGYIPNWPHLASWDSESAAYTYMGLTVITTIAVLRNGFFFANIKHTKAVYIYLFLWCLFRLTAFGMRGHVLHGNNGENLDTYKHTQIVLSIGFMPLAEALTLNIAESSTLIYELSHRTYIRLRILIIFLFLTFGISLTAFVIDFTMNKPFGANAKDYATDLILREVGFNGLFLITIYTFVAAIRNAIAITRKKHIPTEYVTRMRKMMWIVCGQSALMMVKLGYITYRNWNPQELKEEWVWYMWSVTPEFLYVLPCLRHGFVLSVFDDVEGVVGEDGEHTDVALQAAVLEGGRVGAYNGTNPEKAADCVVVSVETKLESFEE
ncbi:hypothetical protein BDR26DRAFT_1014827 [Obelidium mucronatum]|nr:hypothetical protein BDR26DRAFT_1014827 [Obelidium mucronatum]